MIPVCYDLSQLDGIFLIRCLLVFNQVLFKDLHYGQIDDEKTDTDDQQISKGILQRKLEKSAYLSAK